jgi:hypothetical protein
MAMATKAKEPASDSIMAADKMKPLLALSKREPVQAAIGLTADGEGVILLDRKLKPKKVVALLKANAAKAKLQLQPSSLRFGKAEVDTDYDPGMVRFFLNKEAPGNMRAKLVEVVKRIPYQKVELNIDSSFDEEPEDEEPETDAKGAPVDPLKKSFDTRMAEMEPQVLDALRGRRGDASKMRAVLAFAQEKGEGRDYAAALKGLDALAKLLVEAGPSPNAPKAAPPPAPPQPPPQLAPRAPAPPDAGALVKELSGLARRIPEVPDTDPALKAKLLKLATDANVNIKTNNLRYATDFIAQLREALREALDDAGVTVGRVVPPGGGNGAKAPESQAPQTKPPESKPPGPTAPALNGMALWQAERGTALASLKKLEGAFRAMKEPEVDRAIILLRAIQANLTAAPTTPAQVRELEAYLNTDRIIQEAEMPNGFGFKVELRKPLLAALAGLRGEPGTSGGSRQ